MLFVHPAESLRKSIDTNSLVACSSLDLSKAFYSIDHNNLGQKVKKLIASEPAIELINFS